MSHAWNLESRDKKVEDLVPAGGSPSRKEFTPTEKRFKRCVAKIPVTDTHRKLTALYDFEMKGHTIFWQHRVRAEPS